MAGLFDTNIVVLDLKTYHAMQDRIQELEKQVKSMESAVSFKKSYWDNSPECRVDLAKMPSAVHHAWDNYAPKDEDNVDKNKFVVTDPDNWNYASVTVIEKIPEPEPEEEQKDESV